MQPTAPNRDVNYFGVPRFQAVDAFLKANSDSYDMLAELLGEAEILRDKWSSTSNNLGA
jgi:hypothetical protein